MSIIKYLSPTSYQCLMGDADEFVRKYVLGHREPQNKAMAAGSAFDAFVKWRIIEDLRLETEWSGVRELFEDQVAENLRDWGWEVGASLMERYDSFGAYPRLRRMLEKADSISVESTTRATVSGVPILGKPDIWFWSDGVLVIFDWKVNGYMSRHSISPKPGYQLILPKGTPHRNYFGEYVCGSDIEANAVGRLDEIYEPWAIQLMMYVWTLNDGGGDCVVIGIDQLVFNKDGKMRVAMHRNTVNEGFCVTLRKGLEEAWDRVCSGRYWPDLDDEQTAARIESLRGEKDWFE